jgi:predicted DNA-binding protein
MGRYKVERTENLGLTLSVEEKEQLQKCAKKLGITMSAFVRLIIKNHLEREEK